MAKKWWEIPAVILLMLGLAILSTYPLLQHFDTGIPFAPFGGGKVWNRSGDQVQLLYWFWLVKENFIGAVPFDTNPYEFNMPVAGYSTGLNTVPLAFLYMLFSPLGDITAYNCTVISSYVLAGLFMYLLVRLYTGSRTGALLGAVIFTFAPSRINGFTAGHGYGLLYFLYPFILFFLEKGIRSQKIRYGVLSALGLLSLAMLEPHLIYYICVFLGMFIPFRLLAMLPVQGDGVTEGAIYNKGLFFLPVSGSFVILAGSVVAAVFYSHILFDNRTLNPFIKELFWWAIALYPVIAVLAGLCLASLYQRLAPLNFRQALAIEAGSMLPLYLLVPLALLPYNDNAPDTDLIVATTVVLVFITKLLLLSRQIGTMVTTLVAGFVGIRKNIWPVLPVIISMGMTVAWIVFSKVDKVASTIAGGGRRLDDVGLFSAQLADVVLPTSNVYIGIIPALLFGYLLARLGLIPFRKAQPEGFSRETDLLALFYAAIAYCCYLLALGVAFGNSSLYVLFFHYFPFFNYPRVSDRIITLVLFALAIGVGFVVQDIQQRFKKQLYLGVVTVLFLGASVFQLKDFSVFKQMGINILDRGQDVYTYVKENIDDGLLLEIPLWPGDSHQSSLYQHYIMLDRVPRVNGCSPLVQKEYIETVFEPLNDINQGRLGKKQYELLRKMNVKYITVHDNRDVFLPKVSPFVPLTTVRRLANSPYLEVVDIDNNMYFKTFSKKSNRLHLLRVKNEDEISSAPEQAWYDMPYIYDPYIRLHKQTGDIIEDKRIGRWVFEAKEGQDSQGFLVYGPYDTYPPGKYRAVFNVSAQAEGQEIVARVEVASSSLSGDIEVLAQQDVTGQQGNDRYKKIYLNYSIEENTRFEFRVFYYGKGTVRVEQIAIYTAGKDGQLDYLEAEKMVGNTGFVVIEKNASGGKVIEARTGKGKSKPGKMVFGPHRIYRQGNYTARFFLRRLGDVDCAGKGPAAVLTISDETAQDVFARRRVSACEVNAETFTPVDVNFDLHRAEELSFNVYYKKVVGLQLDGIEVKQQ